MPEKNSDFEVRRYKQIAGEIDKAFVEGRDSEAYALFREHRTQVTDYLSLNSMMIVLAGRESTEAVKGLGGLI